MTYHIMLVKQVHLTSQLKNISVLNELKIKGMPASYIRNTFLRDKYTRLNNYFLTPDTNLLRPTVSTFLSNREK